MFIYQCQTECQGYTIRKSNLKPIFDEFPEMASHIKKNCEYIFEFKIKYPILKYKKMHIKRLS